VDNPRHPNAESSASYSSLHLPSLFLLLSETRRKKRKRKKERDERERENR